jgi:ankyrin repeat protein
LGELPLQRTCRKNAPLNVIQLLVETWPDAVKEKSYHDWLPLHFACSNKYVPLNVIQLLVKTWPDAVKEKTKNGWLPLHFA